MSYPVDKHPWLITIPALPVQRLAGNDKLKFRKIQKLSDLLKRNPSGLHVLLFKI